jgi:hypothetical protein
VPSMISTPRRSGRISNRRRQMRSASHGACVGEMLKRLIGDRLRDPRQQGPHRFGVAVAEHAPHLGPQGEPLRAMTETTLKWPAHQPLNVRGRGAIDPRAAACRIRRVCTMSSHQITETFRKEQHDLTK